MTPLLLQLEKVMRRFVTDDFSFHHIPGALPWQSTVRVVTPGFNLPVEARTILEETVLNTVPAAYQVTLEYFEHEPPYRRP